MDNYSAIVSLLMIAALVGVFMLGVGITGMSISTDDVTVRPLCLADYDCSEGNVCCYFYAKQSGVCDKADMCAKISAMTSNTDSTGAIKATPSRATVIIEFAAGLMIIIFSLLLTYKYIVLESDKDTPH
jgi:hypothetical protein